MANENETVEQVYDDIAGREKVARSLDEDSVIHNSAVADLLHNVNGRWLAAHKRKIAAHKRELAEKDAEILSLRALVKELSDALESSVKGVCWYCGKHRGKSVDDITKCLDSLANGRCGIGGVFIELVAKAREVCK